ncbi:MAG: DJ-1/PfpI family protein [Pseudobdellovibrionaceae bacterium]
MQKTLSGKSAAILVANGFNEIEMTTFQRALIEAGASPKLISTESSLAHGWQGNGWGHYHPVDKHISDALAADYDMLIVSGGYRGHDKLKMTAHTRRFIGGFMAAYKPVLATGDAVKMMAELGMLQATMVTGDAAVRDAVVAAGAVWSENSPVIHGNLLSMTFSAEQKSELTETFVNFVADIFAEGDAAQQAA